MRPRNRKQELQQRDFDPNLFDFVPKNIWSEVYHGRWSELRRIQQLEFIVEILFLAVFIGGFAYSAYISNGDFAGLILAFGGVGIILLGYFFLLTRYIR